MDEAIKELAAYRMEKSREDLKAAQINLENDLYAQSINRSYYAMFHAARSLVAFDRFDSKKHSGIIAFFSQHYVKTGKVEIKYGKMLRNAEEIRNDSDYNDFFIASREQAEDQLKSAKEFIARIKEYIESEILLLNNKQPV